MDVKFDFSQQGMVAFKVGNEEPAIILKDRSKFPQAQPDVWIEVEDVRAVYPELVKKELSCYPNRLKFGQAGQWNLPILRETCSE